MAVDLADLAEEKFPPEFTIESEQLGPLGFRAVYGIDSPYLTRRASEGSDEEFIGKLMVAMGWTMDGPAKLTDRQRSALVRADMEAFCEALVQSETSIFGESPRSEGEDWLACVRRVGGDAIDKRRGPFEHSALLDMEESINRHLKLAGLDPSSSALSRNLDASSHLKSILEARLPRFELPPIPRNPIVDTNAILHRVEEQISRMAEVSEASAAMQTTLNDYAQSAITEMKTGSKQTNRNASLALGVGVVGVLVAVITIVISANQQSKADAVRKEDARVAARERQADRTLMERQLEATRRNTEVLEKLVVRDAPANVAK
ncbi:hypothetical protein [Caulobacter sp.]|uniref:hypothetical protein n=1 Tax=Caulobacter sp. TaxID=78 RepID=UPI003BA86C04